MNYRVERIQRPPGRLREMGDRLTGGGVRALIQRLLRSIRHTGDRLTGGGLRSMSTRMAMKSLRIAMSQPFLKALGRLVLTPFPSFSARVYRLATAPDTMATTADAAATTADAVATTSISLPQHRDHSLLVNSLYKTAFGRIADADGLANCSHQLELGVSLEDLAEQIVTSVEFQTRHGSSQRVDIKYLTALYRDGLGRHPDLESLAFWLGQRDEQGIRATLLASVAGSDEALESLLSRDRDEHATYERWIVGNDTISELDRATIRAHIAGLPFHPLISVIMRIDRTSGVNVCESSKSLARQLYPYWELCIAVDDLSEQVLAATPLTSVAQRTRVTQTHNTENEWAAINAALSLATGDFVAFLRPGDILPEHALYEVAFELAKHEQIDVIYTDHDHVSPDGKRSNPWFKPGWDPDLLLGQNYIRDLTVYRRTLVESAGFLRPGFEGAEFHELALRVTAATTPDRIGHIPAILYHRRDQNQADPKGPLSGLDSGAASHRAVRQQLDYRGDTKAQLEPVPQLSGAVRVVWPLPMPEPLVSVIVPTRDRADLLAQCVDGVLHRTDYRNRELLIVDNGSTEQDALVLFDRLAREEDGISILRQPGPFNYSAMNNAAARKARGEVLVLLNNDVDVLEPGWLRELVTHALRLDVGAVGAKLLYKNGQIQHAGIVLGPEGAAMHLHRFRHRNDTGYCGQLALTRSLSAVTGACIAIRRSVFIEVGGFDEINLAVAFNDVDLCLRLGDYGYRVVWTPFAELLHLESASRVLHPTDPAKQEQIVREWQHLRKTWGSLLESADPFHNPNILFGWDFLELPSAPRREKPWHLSLSVPLNFEQRAAPAKILHDAR
jgi:GT2 family glycosyltransferase